MECCYPLNDGKSNNASHLNLRTSYDGMQGVHQLMQLLRTGKTSYFKPHHLTFDRQFHGGLAVPRLATVRCFFFNKSKIVCVDS